MSQGADYKKALIANSESSSSNDCDNEDSDEYLSADEEISDMSVKKDKNAAPPQKEELNAKMFDDSPYPIHKCVFENDYNKLAIILRTMKSELYCIQEELARKDKHGNTPLHLATMLGRKICLGILLNNNAPVKVKNSDGWTPLAEAISFGNRQTIKSVLGQLKKQSRSHIDGRRSRLVEALKQMRDFYMELKWDFTSWVPLVSRILPSDICRIHKCGSSVRFDTTLVDFNDMRWERGNISFIFRGDLPSHESIIVLDNEMECYQVLRCEDIDLDDEVDMLMSTDIVTTQMSTKSIRFSLAQSGWLFRADRKELVGGQYQCDVYTIQGLVLKQRKRREHLSHEDLQKNRAIVENITMGVAPNSNETRRASATGSQETTDSANSSEHSHETQHRNSLEPPEIPKVTWHQYISAPVGKCPQLGRTPVLKQSNKSLRATVAMSRDFPLSIEMLLDVLEVVAPLKHINKLREFVTLKLPPGFPVKFEIPVLHMVTAKVTFQKFEFRDNIPGKMFEIPIRYLEDKRRFQDL